jgi:SAM-dependent methyltransferase
VPDSRSLDYSSVTETWGHSASPEQLSMLYTRYRFAVELAAGGRVLDVGSGAGMGLAYLRQKTHNAIGGDYTMALLEESRRHLPDAPIVRLDAQQLPFADESFDLVLMLEMIYYLPDFRKALGEARRVLKPGGRLLVTVPNPDRPDFNPSPFSTGYHNGVGLTRILRGAGFEASAYGAFPIAQEGPRDRMLAPIRHLAVRLHLIPRSMRLKSLLKRVLYGRAGVVEGVADDRAAYNPPVEIPTTEPSAGFKTLYAVGRRT